MASEQVVQRFNIIASQFKTYGMSNVYREGLGSASLIQAKSFVDEIGRRTAVAYSVMDAVADQTLDQFARNLEAFLQSAQSISSLSDSNFVEQRPQSLQRLRSLVDEIGATIWPAIIAVALEKSGVLSSSSSQVAEIQAAGTAALEEFKQEAHKLITAQKSEIEEITSRVRRSAEGISLGQAQKQFEDARRTLWNKARAWGAISLLSFVGFILLAVYLMHHPPSSLLGTQLQQTAKVVKETSGADTQVPVSLVVAQTAYLTAIRITLLTALGALTTFCLRMMRSAIHMAEYNDHRRRIANSISSFVEAAGTPEQRDAILLRLVDSVVQFGESGLLENGQDSVSAPSIAFEAITKNLAPSK